MKSKVLALSAISAGFVAIFLILGSYVSFVDIFCTVVSSVFVLMPLYLKSYKGSFLSYLVGGAISLLICLPTFLFSFVIVAYFVFFGIYPIIKMLAAEKGFNKKIFFVIGLIWCIATIYGVYFYYTGVMGLNFNDLPKFIADYILIFLAPIGAFFFIIYDRFIFVCKMFLDKYLSRVIK